MFFQDSGVIEQLLPEAQCSVLSKVVMGTAESQSLVLENLSVSFTSGEGDLCLGQRVSTSLVLRVVIC